MGAIPAGMDVIRSCKDKGVIREELIPRIDLQLKAVRDAYPLVFDTDFHDGDVVLYHSQRCFRVGVLYSVEVESVSVARYSRGLCSVNPVERENLLCKMEEDSDMEFPIKGPEEQCVEGVPAIVYYRDEIDSVGFVHKDEKFTFVTQEQIPYPRPDGLSYRNERLEDGSYNMVPLRPARRQRESNGAGPYR